MPFILMICIGAMVPASMFAQMPIQGVPGIGNVSTGRFSGAGKKGEDSLKHRSGLEDSITIRFRYLDTSSYNKFDSAIYDFNKRFPIPYHHIHLGNNGSATRALGFSPIMKSGWDAGFHAYDVYRLTVENTRFFNTTRPYSEIGYMLGSRAEQMLHALVTQNINPNWNVGVQYNLINAPGYFKNQSTNHSRYRINSMYQSPNRRYHLFFILAGNKLQSAENGGIQSDSYIDSLVSFKERSNIPVQLGNYVQPGLNPFNSQVTTGNKYQENLLLLRQQYDLGKKDSVVTDSNVVYLFYPKFRAEHTFQYNHYRYRFIDQEPDNIYYRNNYNFFTTPDNNFQLQESWKEIINDLSVYSFPEAQNPAQFLKMGAAIQNLTGTFSNGQRAYYNIFLHGEYRNKTRNKKWDIAASGNVYIAGYNSGDYRASASVKRYISEKIGYFQAGLENVNRTPSFVFDASSSFNFGNTITLNKENITRLFAQLDQPKYKMNIAASYYLVTNFSYFKNYYETAQASNLFNVLQVIATKDFRLRKHLIWHAMVMFQQKVGNSPVNLPLFFTRNQIGYEGNLGFKNLEMNTGLEFRYHTPYKANGYSPLLGQFFYQDQQQLSLRLPDIHAYLHFRIRSFTSYVRLENLNTMRFKGGFGFTNNNFAATGYPYPGMVLRIGIFWSFVN